MQKFDELPIDEQIDFFISQVSANDMEVEIRLILSLFTAFNMDGDTYQKYFDGCDVFETTDKLFEYMAGSSEEEDIAWNAIINTLRTQKIFDIIDNIEKYMETYNEVHKPIEETKYQAMKLFTKLT